MQLLARYGHLKTTIALIAWLILTFSAAATGAFVSTDGWYAELIKPAWNPPSWIFGPVWTVLYAMMAVAAVSRSSPTSISAITDCCRNSEPRMEYP